VIRAYFDDSGSEGLPSGSHVCLAGYLADDHYWVTFNRLWRHQLARHGIGCVHMKDLIPLQGEYKSLGLDTTKRDQVIGDFIRVIQYSELIGFGVAVDAAAWREARKQSPKSVNAQMFCFARLFRLVVERMKKSAEREWLNVHFDSNPEFGAQRLRLFDEIRRTDESARWFFPSITFADMRTYLPLQAADILAWESRKELLQKAGGYESTPRFKELVSAMGPVDLRFASELWDREEIEKLVRDAANGTVQP